MMPLSALLINKTLIVLLSSICYRPGIDSKFSNLLLLKERLDSKSFVEQLQFKIFYPYY